MTDRFHPGRYILFEDHLEGDFYVTSWDTWDECEVAFPIAEGHILIDDETGQEWKPGSKHKKGILF